MFVETLEFDFSAWVSTKRGKFIKIGLATGWKGKIIRSLFFPKVQADRMIQGFQQFNHQAKHFNFKTSKAL